MFVSTAARGVPFAVSEERAARDHIPAITARTCTFAAGFGGAGSLGLVPHGDRGRVGGLSNSPAGGSRSSPAMPERRTRQANYTADFPSSRRWLCIPRNAEPSGSRLFATRVRAL